MVSRRSFLRRTLQSAALVCGSVFAPQIVKPSVVEEKVEEFSYRLSFVAALRQCGKINSSKSYIIMDEYVDDDISEKLKELVESIKVTYFFE